MNLVQEYLQLVTDVTRFREFVHDTASAEIHNGKVKRMRTIAITIENSFPALKNDFCEMLSLDNEEICLWVAHDILEVMNCTQAHRKSALKIIRHKAKTDKSAYGFGEKVWLKDWYKSHPKDRWI